MSKEILCTLGPSSMNDQTISRLAELGVTMFRINLSHTPLAKVAESIRYVTSRTKVPFCLDSEGAQIRTGSFAVGTAMLQEGSIVRAHERQVPGDAKDFNFYPRKIISKLRIGDFISIDFNSVLVQVIEQKPGMVVMRVINSGMIGSNKAVTVDRDIEMSPFTEKDSAALKIGAEMGIKHFALSFANEGGDVDAMRSLVGDDSFVISKIECRNGLINLADIAKKSDALLIDRGDLSRQISIEQIPGYQKKIIREGRRYDCKMYVATNLLESMVTSPTPTRAEVNDVYNTILDGADGLVLAAETAIGKYPIRCANMVVRIINELDRRDELDDQHHPLDPQSMLIEPNGGQLVQRFARESDLEELGKLPRVAVSSTVLLDCERIANGTYSPLTGFMDQKTLASVLADYTMPDGTPWPLPIVLPVDDAMVNTVKVFERIALTGEQGRIHAVVDIQEIYPFDWSTLADSWFATSSTEHPGVAELKNSGSHFIAGEVTMVEGLPNSNRHYELNPVQTRLIFTHKGWDRVVGFPTDEVAHKCHEKLLTKTLEESGADGLFIVPLQASNRARIENSDVVQVSYQTLLEYGIFPQGRVAFGSLAIKLRHSGAREMLFRAICLKNIGCSHILIPVDDRDEQYSAIIKNLKTLFESIDGIGITPIFHDILGYHEESDSYLPLSHPGVTPPWQDSQVDAAIKEGDSSMPGWFIREQVQNQLIAAVKKSEQ
ncbi:MAG: sulfate adenylyltransferase [Magnetococcales bacterium]|nr:sulfate adenylyltransferase [Magnetococcales bacterium]